MTKLILAFRNFADAPKKVASEGSRMWRVLANLVNCYSQMDLARDFRRAAFDPWIANWTTPDIRRSLPVWLLY